MGKRIAVIAIIIDDLTAAEAVNDILHEASDYIIGRMGIPYRSAGVNIISVAVDAPETVINALSGKLGQVEHVSSKTAYSNVITEG